MVSRDGAKPQDELEQLGGYVRESSVHVVVVDTKRSYLSRGEAGVFTAEFERSQRQSALILAIATPLFLMARFVFDRAGAAEWPSADTIGDFLRSAFVFRFDSVQAILPFLPFLTPL
jgi:hypothetical protein